MLYNFCLVQHPRVNLMLEEYQSQTDVICIAGSPVAGPVQRVRVKCMEDNCGFIKR